MKLYQKAAQHLPQFVQMTQQIGIHNTPVLMVGLSDVHKAHFIYAAAKELGHPILVVTEEEAAARRMCDDINIMEGKGETFAFLFPERDFTFRQVETVSREYEQIRLGILSRIRKGECPVCLCSINALLQHTIPPKELSSRTFTISSEGNYAMDDLVSRLLRAGYVRRPQVEGIAQFSVRGGILDIYPPSSSFPVRIEFWEKK